MYYYPLSSLRAAYDFHIAPSVRRCEKLIPAARQTKPSAPPSLLCKGLQSGWGRRFRLPGQFFTRSDAWGYHDPSWTRPQQMHGAALADVFKAPLPMLLDENLADLPDARSRYGGQDVSDPAPLQ